MKKLSFIFIVIVINVLLANAQSKVVPIISIKDASLLGGVQNGKFLNAKLTVGKLSAKQNYKTFFLDGTTEDISLKRPYKVPEESGNCPDQFGIAFRDYDPDEVLTDEEAKKNPYERGGVALGIGFDWDPQPRVSEKISLDSAEYKKLVANFLLTKRIENHDIKLEQALSIDLEGDGQSEVLLVASRIIPFTEKEKGNKSYDEYSIVLLRKIVNGKPQTVVVAQSFELKNKYPNYFGDIYEIASILDLNADGKMEIVLHRAFDEGSGSDVYQISGNKLLKLNSLAVSCGI